jgi:hypothetical protein
VMCQSCGAAVFPWGNLEDNIANRVRFSARSTFPATICLSGCEIVPGQVFRGRDTVIMVCFFPLIFFRT